MYISPLSADAADTTPVAPATSPELAAALARARGLGASCAAAPLARAMLEAAVETLWQRRAPEVPLRAPFAGTPGHRLSAADRGLADRIGAALAERDTSYVAESLGGLYISLLPKALRSAQGSYYTPPALAEMLLERATEAGTDWTRARVLDPACGGGAILLPALRQLLAARSAAMPEECLRAVAERLQGIDLDPVAAWLAQVMVDLELLPLAGACGRPLPRIVTVGDALDTGPSGDVDLVVGNPPYGQLRLCAARKQRFARSLQGRANLYGLFFDRALELLRPGGVIAYLTPPGLLGGRSFQNLRALLAREAPPVSLDFLTKRVGIYADVQQETMLSVWRRGGAPAPLRLRELALGAAGCETQSIGPGRLPAAPAAPWLLPRRRAHAAAARAAAQATERLADWGYRVRTGPVEPKHRDGFAAAQVSPRHVPLLWAEAIDGAGRLTWPQMRRSRAPWIDATGREAQLTRGAAVLVKRTTAPEQPRRLVASALPADLLRGHDAVAVENHLNILEPTGREPAVAPDLLACVLNSAAADRVVRCLSGTTAISAYELEALPLPSQASLARLESLLARGAGRVELEAECARLYGVPGC